MNSEQIATICKHMVCPDELIDSKNIINDGYQLFKKYKFRHLSESYTGKSIPSTDILLKTLISALPETVTSGNKQPLLLLSDGKDSMALALALSKAGIKSKTLTLLRNSDEELKNYVEGVCKKLGHEAYFITVDEIMESISFEESVSACGHMEKLVLDQGFLFFLTGLSCFFRKQCINPAGVQIIDGLGNDEHFGYLPNSDQLKSLSLSKFNLWKLFPNKFLFLRWYFRSPAESHGDLSALSVFFPIKKSLNLNLFFSKVFKKSAISDLDIIDLRAFSRGAFHDHQCMMGKTKAAAHYLGSTISYPWSEENISNYCFNLPLEYKFDFRTLENKIILRKLLNETIGWKQEKRGVDLYYDLDPERFYESYLSSILPDVIKKSLKNSAFIPKYVKKRAYLELYNLVCFCTYHNKLELLEEVLLGE
jgi:hypothetical protein